MAESANADDKVEVIVVHGDNQLISNNFEVLKREDFINSSQTLAEVLQNVNGLQIRQIGGIGNPVAVSIRGSNSKQVQLYIDGQLMNDSQFGGFDLNQIPTEHIESIEISKNQAIGTGSTPIGGVIRINTYNPNKATTNVSIAAGSFGYQEANLLTNQIFKKHRLSLGANYLTSDNDYEYTVEHNFNNRKIESNEPLRNNQFNKKSFFINDNISFDKHQIRLNIQYRDQEKALPNYQDNTPENYSELSADTWRYSYQHIWYSDLDWLDTIEFELYHENKEEHYLDIPAGKLETDAIYNSKNQSFEITPFFTFDYQHGEFKVTPFLNVNKQSYDALSFLNGEQKSCNGVSSCDVNAEQKKTVIGSRFEWKQVDIPLSAYVLMSKLKEENSNVAINQENAELKSNHQRFYTNEVGVVYQLNKKIKTEFIISNGIRTATLFELFGDRGLFKGNDELLPEKARTVTFGSEYKDRYFNKEFFISTSIYQQNLDNSLVAIFNSSGIGSYQNVSDATLKGIEIEGNVELSNALSVVLQGNFIDSETTSEIRSFNNNKVPNIYHQQYSAALKYQLNNQWNFNLRTNVDTGLYFNRPNTFQNGRSSADRKLTDLIINWHNNKYNTSLLINNMFDEQYQDLANRPAQGINIQLKLSIKGI
jgi:outer membrane cobalamin receptor